MKNTVLLLLSLTFLIMNLSAQNLYIHKTDGTVVEIPMNQIDSITFTNGGGAGFECGVSTVTDLDGNVYSTVLIGSQCWLGSNLKTTKYNDGSDVPLIINASVWDTLTSPGFSWYDNNPSYKDPYGGLYNWYSIDNASNGGKNVCPEGWHVPSDAEWTSLTDFLGGLNAAGGKLKEAGTTHWNSPNSGATNETGFTALPGGYREISGGFTSMGNLGRWWSGDEHPGFGSSAYFRGMSYNSSSVLTNFLVKKHGFSVRCLKD